MGYVPSPRGCRCALGREKRMKRKKKTRARERYPSLSVDCRRQRLRRRISTLRSRNASRTKQQLGCNTSLVTLVPRRARARKLISVESSPGARARNSQVAARARARTQQTEIARRSKRTSARTSLTSTCPREALAAEHVVAREINPIRAVARASHPSLLPFSR